ncbi:MAG: hypothetical protein ETSY2_47075 [Candidatus Entotheonella gemina]|uniref:Putative heavy-metal chelation domain-containing protein n=1 Tax=Candidatus Entotheonella gemina TaxID=1429439 RepID=W4LDK1_9BACT|nr:MAG: hypothetical protein ETSY2_47075 [Candidatus Entotheonella gemina]
MSQLPTIAEQCLALLKRLGLTAQRRVTVLVLTDGFSVVQLDNGALGVAMSYVRLPVLVREHIESSLIAYTAEDPLLFGLLFNTPPDPEREMLYHSIRAALLAALSEPVLCYSSQFGLMVENGVPKSLLSEAQCAVVIGFGGLMMHMVGSSRLERLHVVDLTYPQRKREMSAVVDALRLARPELTLTISDGTDLPKLVTKADLIAITGSALCNGTLDSLLAMSSNSQVIVQGQSIAMHPGPLFDRGVIAVVTTRKPKQIVAAAQSDRSGVTLSRWLEGGLPFSTIRPLASSESR